MASTIALLLAGGPGAAFAEAFDGKAPAERAISESFECASTRQCVADQPDAMNIPRLIRIDFVAKKAFTMRTNGEERVAPITAQQIEKKKLILMGFQDGYGWTMAISQENGAMA